MQALESSKSVPGRRSTALLLIAHGSRQTEANDDLIHLTKQLRACGLYDCVEASFLEMAEPTIDEGGELCVQAGAERVILLPFFLSAGIHVQRDLTEARRRLAERHTHVRFDLARPLSRHPLLVDIVLERAREMEA